MQSQFRIPMSASLLAAAVTTGGIMVIRRYRSWGERNTTYFACFAAGVLVSVSFLHIVPKALAMNPNSSYCLLVGYLLMHVCNRFVTVHVCDRPTTADYAIGLIPVLGIGFHSFIDGMIYSVTFSASMYPGVLASLGMIFHEFPEGIVTYVLRLRGGFSAKHSFQLAFLAAACTTPLGTLVSYPLVSRIDNALLGILLSLSAGALVYVGATHLLPRAEREPRRYSLVALGSGILVAIGIIVNKS